MDETDFLKAGRPVSSPQPEGGTRGWQEDDFPTSDHGDDRAYVGASPAGPGGADPLNRPAPPPSPKPSMLQSKAVRLGIIAGALGAVALGLSYPVIKNSLNEATRPLTPPPAIGAPLASLQPPSLQPLSNLPGVMPLGASHTSISDPEVSSPAPLPRSAEMRSGDARSSEGGASMDRLEHNLTTMATTMSRISDTMSQVTDAVSQTQGKVSAFEARFTAMGADVSKLGQRETALEGRVKKLERTVLGHRSVVRHAHHHAVAVHPAVGHSATPIKLTRPKPVAGPVAASELAHWELRGVSQQRSRIVLANGVDSDGQARLATYDVGKSSLPGWGRILEVRPSSGGQGGWEVVTEKGIALTGGADSGIKPIAR